MKLILIRAENLRKEDSYYIIKLEDIKFFKAKEDMIEFNFEHGDGYYPLRFKLSEKLNLDDVMSLLLVLHAKDVIFFNEVISTIKEKDVTILKV